MADLGRRIEELVGDEPWDIHVGTDSKVYARRTHFATAVALLEPGRGGRAFYARASEPRRDSLIQRLLREAELSLAVALDLAEHLPQDVILHLDVNRDPPHRSSRYARALAGMALGCGLRVLLKPEAWCASSVADSLVKGHLPRAA